MKIREILAEGVKRLYSPQEGAAFIDSPALDAALLLAETLRARREDLIIRGNENVTEDERGQFSALLERRLRGECVAYILGHKEFRGLEFRVNPAVLVPRPDTETLAEAALEYIDTAAAGKEKSFSLLDLCTGSGAVAVTLKKERPFLEVSASDISPEALEIAAMNAARLLGGGLTVTDFSKPVRFIKSDIFENIDGKFNFIVSNPPYVPRGLLPGLAPEVRREPEIALNGGADGLFFIRKIISGARDYLLPGGTLLLEAGPEQMPKLCSLLEGAGYTGITLRKDMAGRERVVSASLPFLGVSGYACSS